MLTYWTTYLYGRCNKSVSIATPAYYAHWAARRARVLHAVDVEASSENMRIISQLWCEADRESTMFFL
jgi:hypothetical protein